MAATCVYRDGRPADADALATLALRNDGHFTSMQLRGGGVPGLGLHLARLVDAHRALYAIALDPDRLRDALRGALAADGRADASVRVMLPAPDATDAPVVLVAVSPPVAPPAPVRVRTVVHERMLPAIKHLGTFDLWQHRREAAAAGYADVLFVGRDGRIREGSTWNIVFAAGSRLVWPIAPALRGTTEALLRTALGAAGVDQADAVVTGEALAGFDAAAACNSRGAWAVATIDGQAFPASAALAARLQAALAGVAAEVP